jgi:Arc-like DNA binding domain
MARKRHPTEIVALQVRLTEALRKELADEAEKNKRSLNSEILWRLGQTLDARWQEYISIIDKQHQDEQEMLARLRADPEHRKLLENLITKVIGKKE